MPGPNCDLDKQLRKLLLEPPDEKAKAVYLDNVDKEVRDFPSLSAAETFLKEFEEEIQKIYRDIVDHGTAYQLEAFVDTLFHLRPILPSKSVILTWFLLVLRPALRQPDLAPPTLENAKELILMTLTAVDDREQIRDFRRRVMELYFLGALNEDSGDDILEWARLDGNEKERQLCWKNNLEDVLIHFGLRSPTSLMDDLYECFSSPTSRLQVLLLFDNLVSRPEFVDKASTIANHRLLNGLLMSLLLDTSSTAITIGLGLLVKLIPIIAVEAGAYLRSVVPQLFAILTRIITWKGRKPPTTLGPDIDDSEDDVYEEIVEPRETEDSASGESDFPIKEEFSWIVLGHAFGTIPSSTPIPNQLFTLLYYLFPRNLVEFLRTPAQYLAKHGLDSLYEVDWPEVIDATLLRTRSEALLRSYLAHPCAIWSDAQVELTDPERWKDHDVPRIMNESMMLEVANAVFSVSGHSPTSQGAPSHRFTTDFRDDMPTPTVKVIDLTQSLTTNAASASTATKPQVSLQNMIAVSVALKSGVPLEVVDSAPIWPTTMFTTGGGAGSPSLRTRDLPPEDGLDPPSPLPVSTPSSDAFLEPHVKQTLAGLQREALLLRNELNMELWLKREAVRHIQRLQESRVVSKNAEQERQSLHNKLREYKSQVTQMQKELKKQQEEAKERKSNYEERYDGLTKKLNDLREQKKKWMAETTELRNDKDDLANHLLAQGKLLAAAHAKVNSLETQAKEDAHKVQRLRDYEKRIDQLTKMHTLWNRDVQMYNQQSEEMDVMRSDYEKMKIRLKSYEETQVSMTDAARAQQLRIQKLEAMARMTRKTSEDARKYSAVQAINADHTKEREALLKEKEKLREENDELKDQLDELNEMVEVLKAQVSGKKGLFGPARGSAATATG